LAWEDLDLAKRTLAVRHSLEAVQGRLALKEPKSASGRRMVKLPTTAVDALLEHRRRLLAMGKGGNPFVFTDADGGFLRKSNFLRRVWGPLLAAAGLEGLRFHDLRHGHASLLLRQSVHPKIVQERLGHSTIKLTMDTCSHLMPDAQDAAADSRDRVFSANGCQLAVKSERAEDSDASDSPQTVAG
jgi:integrase